MKRNFLVFLLLWLGTKLRLANSLQLQTFYFQTQQGPNSNLTVVPNKVIQVCQPGWDTRDRLVCRHSNYHTLLQLFSRTRTIQHGWQVFCPEEGSWVGSCQMTPPDSLCMRGGFSYVGNICDFTKFHDPQEEALSNQTSGPDNDKGFVTYIAIGIFVVAFLFPCALGICCFYCEEDASDRELPEENSNRVHEQTLQQTISVIGRNPSFTPLELELQNAETTPPSYEACNEAADFHDG